jgi:diguanylate cyclase (GGDEF)-like protein
MTNSYLPYVLIEVYCGIYALTILFHINFDMGSEHEIHQLQNMIYSYLGLVVTDIPWALTEEGAFHPSHLLNAAYNGISIICITLGCYFWFKYIEDRLKLPSAQNKKLQIVLKIPALVVVALDIISIFTGWLFYIDAGGHMDNTSLFMIQSITNYTYLVIPTCCSAYAVFHTHSKTEQAEYATYSLYMIAPLIAGLLEEAFPTVPLLAMNIFMILHVMFLMIQNLQIYNDALTGLNNRRRLNSYLERVMEKTDAEHPVAVFMMDIDRFKLINDTYGHLEGDNALRRFSAILRDYASENNGFAARYGGDEFCLLMNSSKKSPEEIADGFQKQLSSKQSSASAPSPYIMTACIGHYVSTGSDVTADIILGKADAMLYAYKKEWHAKHNA